MRILVNPNDLRSQSVRIKEVVLEIVLYCVNTCNTFRRRHLIVPVRERNFWKAKKRQTVETKQVHGLLHDDDGGGGGGGDDDDDDHDHDHDDDHDESTDVVMVLNKRSECTKLDMDQLSQNRVILCGTKICIICCYITKVYQGGHTRVQHTVCNLSLIHI